METEMLDELFLIFAHPEHYRCAWRDGELFIEEACVPAVTIRAAPITKPNRIQPRRIGCTVMETAQRWHGSILLRQAD
jgi:hypothetical protein